MLKYSLSPLYWRLLPKDILTADLRETKATCDSCAMAPGKHKGKVTYLPHLKCCTFEPYLPNFLVGALLESSVGERAQAHLQKKISKRQYALPIGMVAPVRFQVEFNQRKLGDFGHREDWLCPYYEKTTQNCGVWRYRGSVCTTFFCKSSYGQRGLKFWEEFGNYLSYVEMALMEEALVQLDFSPRQISDLLDYINRKTGTVKELSGWSLPEPLARKLWNGYFNDQEGFFKKCHLIIKNLDKKTYEEALGEMGCSLQEKTIQRLKHLQERHHGSL